MWEWNLEIMCVSREIIKETEEIDDAIRAAHNKYDMHTLAKTQQLQHMVGSLQMIVAAAAETPTNLK